MEPFSFKSYNKMDANELGEFLLNEFDLDEEFACRNHNRQSEIENFAFLKTVKPRKSNFPEQ